MALLARMNAVIVVALVLATMVPVADAKQPLDPTPKPPLKCFDHKDAALPLAITVDGEEATGHYSLPSSRPTGLVVIGHGYGHSSYSWIEHMKRLSEESGVLAVAMDYRGTEFPAQPWPDDGVPSTRGWRVMEGAVDSIAVTKLLLATCSTLKQTILLGVSMGGNATGLALALSAEERKNDGGPLFDYWIDAEGANNVIETYFEARGLGASGNEFAVNAYEDIKEEMGGVEFEEDPEVYAEHSNLARVEDIAASGVKGVIAIHGLNDGLVPYNQSREFVDALVATGLPVDMYNVVRAAPGSESGTTATGYAEQDPGLAGHASERSTTHSVMKIAFAQLNALLEGGAVGPYREFIVDEDETYPSL